MKRVALALAAMLCAAPSPVDSFRLTPASNVRRASVETEGITAAGDFYFIGGLRTSSVSTVATVHVPVRGYLISTAAGVQGWMESDGDAIHHVDTRAARLANLTVTGSRWFGSGPMRFSLGVRATLPIAGDDAAAIHEVRGLGHDQLTPGMFGGALLLGARYDGPQGFGQLEVRAASYIVRDYYYRLEPDTEVSAGVASGVRLTDRLYLLAEADVVGALRGGPRICVVTGASAHLGPGDLALRVEARVGDWTLGDSSTTARYGAGAALRYALPF